MYMYTIYINRLTDVSYTYVAMYYSAAVGGYIICIII